VAGVLAEGEVESAEAEAYELVRAVLGIRRADVRSVDVEEARATRVLALAGRRAEGVPLQYLTGIAPFRHLELKVGPGVLVPRPETEIVTEHALARLPTGGLAVDVGTGSGAIALSIAYERPDATVVATDAAPDALRWARLNRDELGLRVEIVECDLLGGLSHELAGKIDVIVSNPPYVGMEDLELLPRDVRDHEPPEALFAGERGLAVIERLAAAARGWLVPRGWLVLEVAPHQSDEVRKLLERLDYGSVSIGRDLAGRDRVAEGQR
jgi:release factor glutamine methyltransferase